MSAQRRTPPLQNLQDDIKSAVELYAIFETANSTVGSQIKVSCETTYESASLIVRFKFGNLDLAHVTTMRHIENYGHEPYLYELRQLTRAFVLDIIHNYEKLGMDALVIALWEDAGIALGGEW